MHGASQLDCIFQLTIHPQKLLFYLHLVPSTCILLRSHTLPSVHHTLESCRSLFSELMILEFSSLAPYDTSYVGAEIQP